MIALKIFLSICVLFFFVRDYDSESDQSGLRALAIVALVIFGIVCVWHYIP